jgi:hypothetical protein
MHKTLIAVVAAACFGATFSASAQQAVRPLWNYQGLAVCPVGYDYLGGLCRARSYGGGDGVETSWNRRGSAVCSEGYDFHARSGPCRPQRYSLRFGTWLPN